MHLSKTIFYKKKKKRSWTKGPPDCAQCDSSSAVQYHKATTISWENFATRTLFNEKRALFFEHFVKFEKGRLFWDGHFATGTFCNNNMCFSDILHQRTFCNDGTLCTVPTCLLLTSLEKLTGSGI